MEIAVRALLLLPLVLAVPGAATGQAAAGARTVEVLKQGQYSPMAVEEQVMIIYAVTNGFIDNVPVNRVREWERGFHEFAAHQFPQIGERLRTEKALSKDTEAEIKRAIEAFSQQFAS